VRWNASVGLVAAALLPRLALAGSVGSLLAVALLPRLALAGAVGSPFAGATNANSSSVYWNSGALVTPPDGTWASVDLSGYYIGLNYQRRPEDPLHEPSYKPVSFALVAPDLAFAVALPKLWHGIRPIFGSYVPNAGAVNWPKDGAQRYMVDRAYIVSYAVLAGAAADFGPDYGLSWMVGPAYTQLQLSYAIDFGAYANGKLPAGAAVFQLEDPRMQGHVDVNMHGWSGVASLGAFARPLPKLKLGAGLLVPLDIGLAGTIRVDSPPVLSVVLPTYEIKPVGNIVLDYPMPISLSTEAAYAVGEGEVALHVQWIHRRAQHVFAAYITKSDPAFLEGKQLTVKENTDDWAIGARAAFPLPWPGLTMAGRFDYSPRYIPKEAITAVNLTFTLFTGELGVRWQDDAGHEVGFGYGYIYPVPIHVGRSIFNPRMPSESGLSSPSAKGDYGAQAHKVVLTVAWRWDTESVTASSAANDARGPSEASSPRDEARPARVIHTQGD